MLNMYGSKMMLHAGVSMSIELLLFLAGKKGENRRIQFSPTLQEVEFEDEKVAEKISAKLLDERTGSSSSTACVDSQQMHKIMMQRVVRRRSNLPVAMMSSTINTFCPFLIPSACI